MKRILITGMSGTGKSAAVRELIARGYLAYDLDTPEWSHWVDADPSDGLTPAKGKDWLWREDRVRTLLTEPAEGTLFVSGCAENMKQFFPLFDAIVLLCAPVETIMKRLTARSSDGYGHSEEDRRKVGDLIATVEPLLRRAAHHEVDTRRPIEAAIDEILRLA